MSGAAVEAHGISALKTQGRAKEGGEERMRQGTCAREMNKRAVGKEAREIDTWPEFETKKIARRLVHWLRWDEQ